MPTITIRGENHAAHHTKSYEGCRGILLREDEILLVYETNTDQYFIPGGTLEAGESPAACCIREMAEETGCRVTVGEPLLTVHEFYEEWLFVTHYFPCTCAGETERNLTEREVEVGLEPRWVPLTQAMEIFSRHADYAAENEMKRGAYLREYTALTHINIR